MANDDKGFIGSILDGLNDALGVFRKMALPDLPLPFALLGGALLCLGLSPAGRFAQFITNIKESPKWLASIGDDLWWRSMLISAAIVMVLVYLLARGNTHRHIKKSLGRILAADVIIETGLGTTTAQRRSCMVTLSPVMLTTWRRPAPSLIYICTPDNDRRFPLSLEKNKRVYRGACEEIAFHDAVVTSMSISQTGICDVIAFCGRRFALVDIRNADGDLECHAIAICVGFQLRHDEVRDGRVPDCAHASKHPPAPAVG